MDVIDIRNERVHFILPTSSFMLSFIRRFMSYQVVGHSIPRTDNTGQSHRRCALHFGRVVAGDAMGENTAQSPFPCAHPARRYVARGESAGGAGDTYGK